MTLRCQRAVSVATVLAVVALLSTVPASSAIASNQLLEIPVRWCAIQGSPAAEDPGGVGEPDTDNALWRRHERASDRIWLAQGTQITFRAAFTEDIRADAGRSFPIIDDPSPAPGMPGDILDPNTGDKSEFDAAKQACKAKWEELASEASLLGPIALNVRKLVNPDGTEGLQGYGAIWDVPSTANRCVDPPTGVTFATGELAIADYLFLRSFDPDEEILAHEFGHTLGLEHGNGKNDNADPKFDGYGPGNPGCDPAEQPDALDHTLMSSPGNLKTKLITSEQKNRARAFALVYTGMMIDPPAALLPGDTVGDEYVDSIGEVADPSIDLSSVVFSVHTPSQTSTIFHELIDLLPSQPNHQFLAFADLDDDATTGGAPADLDLGVPTSFQGAEIATRVLITTPDSIAVHGTVWKFEGNGWQEVSDPSIGAGLSAAIGGENGQPQYDVVSISFSNEVRGPTGSTIRAEAFAQALPLPPIPDPGVVLLVGAEPGPFDRVPDLGPDFPLHLSSPRFPVAAVTPFVARPGQAVTVEALGLLPDQMTKIFLGDDMVAVANSDAEGAITHNFVVPFDAVPGERLVTVGSVGTALTADTTVVIEGTPLVPTPVAIDVKPRSCPNPLRLKKRGVVPVAVLGSATLDVSQLDPMLVRLEGVAPLRSSIEDVARPFLPIMGRKEAKDCTREGPDGFADLVLHFDAQTLAAAVGPASHKEVRVVHLMANLAPILGGAPVRGDDVVVTLGK